MVALGYRLTGRCFTSLISQTLYVGTTDKVCHGVLISGRGTVSAEQHTFILLGVIVVLVLVLINQLK